MEQQPRRSAAAEQPRAARKQGDALALLLVLAIAATFAAVLSQTIGFPLGTHADEPKKVAAILTHQDSYAHPILMLELVRAANALAGLTDQQQVAELGRACAVLAGALAIVATFLLAREILPPLPAAAAAAAAAVTPLFAMHARYLKEDVFLMLFILLALLALLRTLDSPTPWRLALLGIAIGLAAATKYIGVILLPFSVVVLLLGLARDTKLRAWLWPMALVTLAALATFALIHVAVIWELGLFQSSLYRNLRRAEAGDAVRAPLALTYGLFHLRQSLLPGLGVPLTVLGLTGFAAPWLAPPQRRKPLLVIAGFAALWLLVHEISPLKPYPNFHRYMLPLAPLLAILGTAFLYELAQRRLPAWSAVLAALAILAAAAPAFYASLRIAGPADDDVRELVTTLVLKHEPKAAFDHYTLYGSEGGQAAPRGAPPAERTAILVTSSLVYDRYRALGADPLQPDITRAIAARYDNLFTHPFLEVTNGRPAFAFFNPVLRIVALEGDAAQLEAIAADLRRGHPDWRVTLVDPASQE